MAGLESLQTTWRRVTPRSIRAAVAVPRRLVSAVTRRLVLRLCVGRLRRLPADRAPGPRLLGALAWGWNSQRWQPRLGYLRECADRAIRAEHGILECGSGLTTLLVGLLVEGRGVPVVSLEQHEGWRTEVKQRLGRARLSGPCVVDAPIEDHGEFAWYQLPESLPTPHFDLVICDGPPAGGDPPATKGGRYGLAPVAGQLIHGSVVLLDDAERAGEQAVLERWEHEFGWAHRLVATDDETYAVVQTTSDDPRQGTPAT